MTKHAGRGRLSLLLAFVLLAGPAGRTAAQQEPLDRVDSLIARGHLTQARTALTSWFRAHPPPARAANPRAHAHALFLQGRLAPDAASAQDAFLNLVLSYPSAPQAPNALLRLGQGLLTIGQPLRAAGYLERLLADYPADAPRQAAALWLARAYSAAQQFGQACGAAKRGLGESGEDENAHALLETEAATACPTVATPTSTSDSSPAARTATASKGQNLLPPGSPQGRYAVQTAALRHTASARVLAARLQRGGFPARVVRLPESSLVRVRVGRYASAADAATAARILRDRGFEAVVVDDVANEIAR